MICRIAEWLRDDRAAVAPFFALMLIPLLGGVAMAGEVSYWWMHQRALQNAADSAAVAAATNDTTTSVNGVPSYKHEAFSVAGQYGFIGNSNITVEPTLVNCPATGTAGCYQVTISEKVPLYLSQIVGYRGNATYSDGRMATIIRANSIAQKKIPGEAFCLTSLGTGSKDGITMNGIPKAATPGCDYRSNTTVECSGGTEPADSAWYTGSSVGTKTCASADDHPLQTSACDPFYDCATVTQNIDQLIPAQQSSDCTASYPTGQAGKTTNYPHSGLPATNLISAAWTGVKKVCGTAQLSGNISLTGDATLVIYNGNFDIGAVNTLNTTGAGSLTIIFTKGTGTDPNPVVPDFTGNGGTLDFSAPTATTSAFHGVAIVIDRDYVSTKPTDVADISGSQWTLKLTGLVYAPNYDVVFSGAVNKSSSGYNCMAVMSKAITLNGSGTIYDQSQLGPTTECDLANLNNLPKTPGTRQALVE